MSSKLYKPMSIVLRRVERKWYKDDTLGTTERLPIKTEMDGAGGWFPQPATTTQLQKCLFNNCDSKKLVYVHVYLKNVRINQTLIQKDILDQDEFGIPAPVPNDTYLYLYANKYHSSTTWATLGEFTKLAIRHKLTRGFKRYISLIKTPLYVRRNDNRDFTAIGTTTFKGYCAEVAAYNFMGALSPGDGYANIDWYWWIPNNYKAQDNEEYNYYVRTHFEYELCVATKWNLRGIEF